MHILKFGNQILLALDPKSFLNQKNLRRRAKILQPRPMQCLNGSKSTNLGQSLPYQIVLGCTEVLQSTVAKTPHSVRNLQRSLAKLPPTGHRFSSSLPHLECYRGCFRPSKKHWVIVQPSSSQLMSSKVFFRTETELIKGQLGVPLTVYPWYLAGVLKGFLGNITHKYPLDI